MLFVPNQCLFNYLDHAGYVACDSQWRIFSADYFINPTVIMNFIVYESGSGHRIVFLSSFSFLYFLVCDLSVEFLQSVG